MTEAERPLVVVYSRSGHTEGVAARLARLSDGRLFRVEPTRYRVPVAWVARAILDILTKAAPQLPRLDLSGAAERPWIVVAGPVWAGQPAAPLRSVLRALRAVDVPVGVLLTCASARGIGRADATCADIFGRPLVATCHVENAAEGTARERHDLHAFMTRLHEAGAGAATRAIIATKTTLP